MSFIILALLANFVEQRCTIICICIQYIFNVKWASAAAVTLSVHAVSQQLSKKTFTMNYDLFFRYQEIVRLICSCA